MRYVVLGVASGLLLAMLVGCSGDDDRKPAGTGGSGGSGAASGGSGSASGGSGGSSSGGGSSGTGTSTSGGGTTSSGGTGGTTSGGGSNTTSATTTGGSGGEAGTSMSAGGAAGESSGGGGEAGADPGTNPVCDSALSFSCADLESQIVNAEYDFDVPEIVITLGDGFPNIKSFGSQGDFSSSGATGLCAYSTRVTIRPPSRVLHIPWPDSGSELYLRNLTLVDECDRTLTLDPGAGCLEPRLYLTTGVSFECADDPYDADCTWDCE